MKKIFKFLTSNVLVCTIVLTSISILSVYAVVNKSVSTSNAITYNFEDEIGLSIDNYEIANEYVTTTGEIEANTGYSNITDNNVYKISAPSKANNSAKPGNMSSLYSPAKSQIETFKNVSKYIDSFSFDMTISDLIKHNPTVVFGYDGTNYQFIQLAVNTGGNIYTRAINASVNAENELFIHHQDPNVDENDFKVTTSSTCLTENNTSDPKWYHFEFSYDADNKLVMIITDTSGKSFTYTYDIAVENENRMLAFANPLAAGLSSGNMVVAVAQNPLYIDNVSLKFFDEITHKCTGALVEEDSAKCEETGTKAYYNCSCGKKFWDESCLNEITDPDDLIISELGHDFENSTAYKISGDQHQKKCSRCDTYDTAVYHTFSSTYLKENSDENKHYHICVCGVKDTGENHTPNIDAATYEDDKYCTVCQYVIEEKFAHTHSGTYVNEVEAKCEETGTKAYYNCSCGKKFWDESCHNEITDPDDLVIPKLDHDFVSGTEYKTEEGGHSKKCSRCDTYDSQQSHQGGIADCQNKKVCSVCQAQYGDFGACTYTSEYVKNNSDAEKHYHICTVCGGKDTGELHTPNVSAATEDTAKYCTVCEYEMESQLPHTMHKATYVEEVAAACKDMGTKAHYACTECDKIFSDTACKNEITDRTTLNILPLGHDFKTGKDYKVEDSGHSIKCSRCDTYSDRENHIYGTYYICEACEYEKLMGVADITEGENQVVSKGEIAKFRINYDYYKFVKLIIDGIEIGRHNYNITPGQTVLVIHADFIETLSVGSHKLEVIFTEAMASTTFAVKEGIIENTNQNDSLTSSEDDSTASSDNNNDTSSNATDITDFEDSTKENISSENVTSSNVTGNMADKTDNMTETENGTSYENTDFEASQQEDISNENDTSSDFEENTDAVMDDEADTEEDTLCDNIVDSDSQKGDISKNTENINYNLWICIALAAVLLSGIVIAIVIIAKKKRKS